MIEAVVLAAGLSSRMGEPKPLVLIHGQPALSHVLRTLKQAEVEEPIVVLGAAAEEIRKAVDLSDCRVLVNPAPESGLSTSLRLGLGAVGSDAAGALIVMSDMPALRPETIRSVITLADDGAQVAAPTFGGRRGFPVYLARALFAELAPTLAGDAGARAFLKRHPQLLKTVEVDDPGSVQDFDRAEDLARFERSSPCATSA